MGIPAYTKIILVPGDERTTRQYGISRAMIIALLVLAVLMLGGLGLLMTTFAGKYDERVRIGELEKELADARQEVMVAAELGQELDRMRGIQEKLLIMLGVEDASPAGTDSLASWLEDSPASAAEGMQRAAALSLSPKPDRWPAKGFVTREFISGPGCQTPSGNRYRRSPKRAGHGRGSGRGGAHGGRRLPGKLC